jgi:MFS family permease
MKNVGPVAACLFISGLCAVVFQTAWLREFRLVFGASTPASAAVLAIFMGGLGLGNALLGRRADAVDRPLRLYAQLELLISAASFVSPFLIDLTRLAYVTLGGQQTVGLMGATTVRLVLSSLVLGLPTFLMGGTLPAAARAVTLAQDDGRRGIGLLYGLNTLGAVVGAVLGTFVFFEAIGTRATLRSACAVNLVVGLSAWWLSAATCRVTVAPALAGKLTEPMARSHRHTHSSIVSLGSPTLFYAAAGLVGFAFFLMEMVWYRMLTPLLGGSTFNFGLILAVALAGIGIGGALYPRLFRLRTPTLYDLALSCGAEALAIAIPLALGDRLAVLSAVLQDMTWFGFWGQVVGWTVVALIVVFPAALISGIQFPLLIALIGRGDKDVGKQVGYAFACNTVGRSPDRSWGVLGFCRP